MSDPTYWMPRPAREPELVEVGWVSWSKSDGYRDKSTVKVMRQSISEWASHLADLK